MALFQWCTYNWRDTSVALASLIMNVHIEQITYCLRMSFFKKFHCTYTTNVWSGLSDGV